VVPHNGEILTMSQDLVTAPSNLHFERACVMPDICARMTFKPIAVTPLSHGPTDIILKEALLSVRTLVFGGYAIGPPGRQQIVYQVASGGFMTTDVPGLRGTVSDLAYDHLHTVYGTSATSQLFKVDDSVSWVSTASLSFDPKATSLASGLDGTVIAYSSSAAYAIQGGQPLQLPTPPRGITSLAVQTATSIAVIANSVLYEFDGSSWKDANYHGDGLQTVTGDPSFPPSKLIASPGNWAVVGAAGILTKRGHGPWRSLAALGAPFPHSNEQPLSGAFLPDGTLVVGATNAVIDAVGPDDSTWCLPPQAGSTGVGVSVWLTDAATVTELDGTLLVTFGSKQGANDHPYVVRVQIPP
jgi:hypothetical protein